MPGKYMFPDFELRTDKLSDEITLRVPDLTKRKLDRVPASRKKILNKYLMRTIDQFLWAENYDNVRGYTLTTDE
jgi:alpha-D-ribose 1-methylphosphonate 5-triphosphate synthase subunit PhnI